MKIKIEKYQLLEICNIEYNVYLPIDKFVGYDEFFNIAKNQNYNGKFFPIPIYFNISSKIFEKNTKDSIEIYYKNVKVCTFQNYNKYKIHLKDKYKIFPIIFGTNDKKHPGVNKFLEENEYYISSKIYNFNKKV
jgi:ATP sulfurylase